MEGQSTAEWPEFPFCSRRCQLVDLGRWLDEAYALPGETEGESPGTSFDAEKESP